MLRIITLLLISAVILNATTYNIVVSNDDHVEILEKIIEGINYFFGIDNPANAGALQYHSILTFVLVIGTLWALVQLTMATMTGSGAMGFKHYFMYLFMVFVVAILIYGPRSQVLIQTRDGSNYGVAKDVPMIFAFTLSMFTQLRYELSDITENAFNVPDPTDNFASGGTGGLGFMGGQNALMQAPMTAKLNKTKEGRETATKLETFLKDCVILPATAQAGGMTVLNNTLNSGDLKTAIAPSTTGYPNELITYDGTTGRCSDFWATDGSFGSGFVSLQGSLTNYENNISANSAEGKLGSALAYFGAVMDNNNAINNAASVKSAITQSVLSNEFRNTFAKMGVAGDVAADGAAQTMADMQINGISTGMFVTQQLPRVAFLLFALMVAATPFLLAFALLPGSAKIILNFLKTLLWISLWEPMANILGIFQDFYYSKILAENGYTTLSSILEITPNNLIDISSEAANLAGQAGLLYVAIQGLSWMLITGSGQMIGNMLSSSANSFANHANADAQLATRSDMQEAALMSTEMGHKISMREKYAFGAAMNAATNAGNASGMMGAHGEGLVGAEHSIAHSGAISTSFQQAQAVSTANEFGSVGTAVKLGTNAGAQNAGTTASQYSRGSTKDYTNIGHVKGGSAYGADKGNADILGNGNTAEKTAHSTSAQDTRVQKETAQALDSHGTNQLESLASHQADMRVNVPVESMEKFKKWYKDKHGVELSDDQAYSQIARNTATTNAASEAGTQKTIEANHGSEGMISSTATNAFDKGSNSYHTAQELDSLGESRVDHINAVSAEKDVGGRDKYVKLNDDEKAITKQKIAQLKDIKSQIDTTLNEVDDNARGSFKEVVAEMAEMKAKHDNGEISDQEWNDFKSGYGARVRSTSLKIAEQTYNAKTQELRQKLANAPEWAKATVQKELDAHMAQGSPLHSLRTMSAATDAAINANQQHLEAQNLSNVETKAAMKDNAIVTEVEQLNNGQTTVGQISNQQGRVDAATTKATYDSDIKKASTVVANSSPELIQRAIESGIDKNDIVGLSTYVQKHDMSFRSTDNGAKKEAVVKADGSIGYSSNDMSKNVRAGTNINVGYTGDAAVAFTGHNPLTMNKYQAYGSGAVQGALNLAENITKTVTSRGTSAVLSGKGGAPTTTLSKPGVIDISGSVSN